MNEFYRFIDPDDLLLIGLTKKIIWFENRIKEYSRSERTRAITNYVGNYFQNNNFKVNFEFKIDGYKRTTPKSTRGGRLDILVENKFVERRIAIEIDTGFKRKSVEKLIFCNKHQKADMLWILHRYAKYKKSELSDNEKICHLIEQHCVSVIELHKLRY